jgi:hypothetical protein
MVDACSFAQDPSAPGRGHRGMGARVGKRSRSRRGATRTVLPILRERLPGPVKEASSTRTAGRRGLDELGRSSYEGREPKEARADTGASRFAEGGVPRALLRTAKDDLRGWTRSGRHSAEGGASRAYMARGSYSGETQVLSSLALADLGLSQEARHDRAGDR